MTDQELEAAVNAAIDAVNARAELRDALAMFVYHGERAKTLLDRARRERPSHVAEVDARVINRVLAVELQSAKMLQSIMVSSSRVPT